MTEVEGRDLEGNCSPDAWNGNTLLVQRIVELFYADEVDEPEAIAHAQSICENCPAISECIDAGMSERWGVWGGLTATERQTMRKIVRHK